MATKLLILLAGLLIGLTSACSAVSGGSVDVLGDTFVVGDSPLIVVNGDNGRIIVNVGPANRVDVTATLHKRDNVEYEITKEQDTITVTAKTSGVAIFYFGQSPGADIEITAPSNTAVELRTDNGRIEVYGMKRSGTIRTSNGKIILNDVLGDFVVTTSNGGVTITEAIGSFDVETSNGRIEFNGEFTSGSANKMKTSNGSVDITLQGIPSVKIDGSTSNGSVESERPILTASTGDKHKLVGTIGEGESTLLVRTSNGSVVIR